MTTRDAAIERLAERLTDGALVLSQAQRENHSHDEAQFAPWTLPDALVLAASVADVRATIEWANEYGVPVVPQGARTGLSGGANGVPGCIALSLERMNRILEIDPVERIAVVQPGVLNATLSRAVEEQGLFYPPDPGSWEISTIGGNVATNAGGLCCVKYGVTTDYVRALEVVMGDGTVLRTGRRTRKGVVGYDLTKLMVGSEGTLGVITEVTVHLITAPEEPVTVAGFFRSVEDAARAVHSMALAGLAPSLVELLDETALNAIEAMFHLGVPDGSAAMLITQNDGGESAKGEFLARVQEIFATEGATDVAIGESRQENDALLAARRNVHFAAEPLGALLTDDVCVPLARLADLVSGARRIGDEEGALVTFVGHAGDGNIHTTVIYERGNVAAGARAHRVSERIGRLAVSLGGTVSGEHGIGNLKTDMLHLELGASMVDVQRRLKDALDPHHVLNPGKLFGPDTPKDPR